jgi:hypothetical protein
MAMARLNATRRHELREQLRLNVNPADELRRLDAIIRSRQLTISDLHQLISTPSASSVLSMLAPAEFSHIRAHMEGGSRSALETTAADLQTELAETLTVAATVVAAATRDITANAFAESGLDLGYTVTTHQRDTVTCVELRRGQEIVLVGVHDGGSVEFDHGGLADDTCEKRQLHLEQAAKRRGVFVVQRP